MKINLHIPCQQFGFVEVLDVGDDPKTIEALYNKYAEKPITLAATAQGTPVECFVGGTINYDPVAHIYTNDAGEQYLSGSKYAAQFGKPFDMGAITQRMEASSGVDADVIKDMWGKAGNASTSFGTAIHEALELYGKYKDTSEKMGKEYHTSNVGIVRKIVADFFKGREKEEAVYEAMVVDHDRKWAGQIDRLLIVDKAKKQVIVGDYKTNGELTPDKLNVYWHQLSHYSAILEAGGYNVLGLEIYHLDDGNWKTYKHEVLEVKE